MEERLTTDQAVAGSSPATDAFAGPKRGCNTQGSHVITHRSTNWACRCLTSQIGRDGVLSPEYGRIRMFEVYPECPQWQMSRRRQDSNLRGQSPVDFGSTPLTAWVRLLPAQTLEMQGIDPCTSRMLSERSTI